MTASNPANADKNHATSTTSVKVEEPSQRLTSSLLSTPATLTVGAAPTNVLYMTCAGNFLQHCEAVVVAVEYLIDNDKNDDNGAKQARVSVILDRTVMYSQGGGQPTDVGTISLNMSAQQQQDDDDNVVDVKNSEESSTGTDTRNHVVVVQVEKVTMDRRSGVVTHTGILVKQGDHNDQQNEAEHTLQPGDKVWVEIDGNVRQILSECHTAGHVVDAAMAKCGLWLKALKGYHYLEGPYVEYQGTLTAQERDTLLPQLQQAFDELVDNDTEIQIELMSIDQATQVCNQQQHKQHGSTITTPSSSNVVLFDDLSVFANPHAPPEQAIRIVTVAGLSCPCGGTHVHSTGALKERQWGITGLKSKKGVVRVKYGQQQKQQTLPK